MKYKLFPPFLFLLFSIQCFSQTKPIDALNSRSDSFDVIHQHINLKIDSIPSKVLQGNCTSTIVCKLNAPQYIDFDLYKLSVDSVLINGIPINYNYTSPLLRCFSTTPFSVNDTFKVSIFYRGIPSLDPSGWGGFYFTNAAGGYAYNLGVGFQNNPHNFGSAWFPCFDSFKERSTYTFEITTASTHMAVCSGTKTNQILLPNNRIKWHWNQNQPIPSYLVGLAVGPYLYVQDSLKIGNRNIPIGIGAAPSDILKLTASFKNLKNAIFTFDSLFGNYSFDKVGYSIVPFNNGAMEHASNIAYPRYAIDGTLLNEALMAHELAHMWWGNTVTCSTPEDMWINEGMARYCEMLFLENVYSRKKYIEEVNKNHKNVLLNAHIKDGAFLPVSGIGHSNTYGDHVYNKGADISHSLRTYLTDTTYFRVLKDFIKQNQFKDVSTDDLNSFILANSSLNTTNFFADWVKNPGFMSMRIDSTKSVPLATMQWQNTCYYSQHLRKTTRYYSNIPYTISFFGANGERNDFRLDIKSKNDSSEHFTLFKPVFIALDYDQLLSDGITDDTITVRNVGSNVLNNSAITINTNSIINSAFIRAEHFWAPADSFNAPTNITVSKSHFWKIDGIWDTTFNASTIFEYNANPANGNLDEDLLPSFSEDSLVMLYRKTISDVWSIQNSYHNIGSMNDKRGFFTISNLQKGEYTFGGRKTLTKILDSKINLNMNYIIKCENSNWCLNSSEENNIKSYLLFDLNGKIIASKQNSTTIETQQLQKGVYFVQLNFQNSSIVYEKLIVY